MTQRRGAERYEALAHFRHDGEHRRPGDILELSTADAIELAALGFVRAVARQTEPAAYGRRDMKAKA